MYRATKQIMQIQGPLQTKKHFPKHEINPKMDNSSNKESQKILFDNYREKPPRTLQNQKLVKIDGKMIFD